MRRALVQLVLDGVADGPVGVGIDVASTAARLARAGLVEVPEGAIPRARLVSLDGAPVRTATGRRLEVDGALRLRGLGRGDVLVLPGLGKATPPEIDAALARDDVSLAARAVARAARAGVHVAASCSAAFVLGQAGVLDGREATTTWWLGPTFAAHFPEVTLRTDRMLISSEGVTTAGSAFAHADLMLALMADAAGPSLAHLVARYLVLDERVSQARYMVADHVRSVDPTVVVLERYVRRNLGRRLTLADMARATATSPRTLARRVGEALGTTPQRFAQRLRVAHAVHLLETTRRSVEDVAERVGYADAAAFRRIFRRETGEAPRERRARTRR